MKQRLLLIGCAFALLSGSAFSQCGSATNRLNQSELSAALSGKTVCATLGNDKWQEYHAPGGDLIDWKKGPSNPVDPTTKVGTWSISGAGNNAVINYSYSGGGTYSFAVYANKQGNNFVAPFDFCGSSNVTNATLSSGQVGCGF
ncbi:hypothetical protein [Sulfuricystis multivorans]|uniref:hypothetical protein n=1 Tax=Sulfuricystis multivorans TaxID=2211108 RepID=UPI000F82301E|nr:hypothetical protein [Sulfuricystis multivorans]